MAAAEQLYDKLQRPYDYIRKSTIAAIERENVREAVASFIAKARILELACGSGFYTYKLLEWGASSVLGVDISSVMIDEARHLEGGLFDIVFGAWLLNYAPDRTELIKMFRTIAMNLKGGGRFVGVTIVPSSNPLESLIAEAKIRPMPMGSGYIIHQYIKDVEDGIYINVHGDTPIGDLDFKCYHLKQEIHEEAAREAGLKGKFEWGVTKVPDGYLKEGVLGGASLAELETYRTLPHFGVLVIVK
ncbi:S-adenosyl-L-methionine-dependent methyltransferase [Hyaloscypha variabilis F]|uniref:S-adenosyl-L-methionine-dependent methyltransferase n=1 Tax=Hyaloscypha variabilis (strain UAMH 11265 / GT02V1 / F) TaxID=1149755 RepID=A0A2J6RP06_HYAVF|nr:S-adenosyl-L-methionine-dependent methyltransferase [Hyaloscypha variabilis F]